MIHGIIMNIISHPIVFLLTGFALFGVGLAAGYVVRQLVAKQKKSSLEATVQKLLDDARAKAKEMLLEARERATKAVDESKHEEKDRMREVRRLEERIMERQTALDDRAKEIQQRDTEFAARVEKIKAAKQEVDAARDKALLELERVAGLSKEDARAEFMARLETEYQQDFMMRIKKMEQTGIEELERRAKNILATLIQRLSTATTSEVTTTTVPLPSDDLKGKIIGKEGRNIKALERAVGVEIIVDDTPGSIVISAFDPVRRQIAKTALELLIRDGRIQPARIEETAEKAREDIEKQIKEAGEQAAYEVGIFDLDPRLLTLLGRLKFRTSYGQNVLQHSIEMTHLAGMLAQELGADVAVAKKGALLHDIGKAVDHEVTGTHVEIGRRILQKFGVATPVIQAMQSHHEESPYETMDSIIVQTVDAISASRPGARRDTLENYLKRLDDLERIAASFDGVEKAYAISAGREIRIFVTPDKINDLAAYELAREVARRIEGELKYPGEIKVNVIREMRAIEYAK